jgi:hypothetical protein
MKIESTESPLSTAALSGGSRERLGYAWERHSKMPEYETGAGRGELRLGQRDFLVGHRLAHDRSIAALIAHAGPRTP